MRLQARGAGAQPRYMLAMYSPTAAPADRTSPLNLRCKRIRVLDQAVDQLCQCKVDPFICTRTNVGAIGPCAKQSRRTSR